MNKEINSIMKVGDLVYFIKPNHAIYSCKYSEENKSGSYQYDFKLMKPYRVDSCSHTWVLTATITDLETGESHFITSEAIDKLITHEDFIQVDREVKLKQLGI